MSDHEDEQEAPVNPDLLAAIQLVDDGGWNWLSVDKVGQIVGVSGKTICKRNKGNALRLELVKVGYRQLLLALDPYESNSPPPRDESYGMIIRYLDEHRWIPKLVLQIQAQAGLVHTEAAREISNAIIQERALVSLQVARLLAMPTHWERDRRQPEADRLMAWYVAICAILAAGPPMSHPDLIAMAQVTPVPGRG